MKFTKPINREIDIDGNTFIVSLSDIGIEFRVKGKRKTASVAWNKVLEIAKGEDGTSASAHLGVSSSGAAESKTEQEENPAAHQTLRETPLEPAAPPRSPESAVTEPQSGNEPSETKSEVGRAVTAGEIGPES